MASPDGHRWATAVDALERCHAQGGDDLHRHILEAVALVDLFRERSGLAPSLNLLETIFPGRRFGPTGEDVGPAWKVVPGDLP